MPCARPLIHGGVPPPNAKKYSHAVKPPRSEASATMRSSSARSSSGWHGGGACGAGAGTAVPPVFGGGGMPGVVVGFAVGAGVGAGAGGGASAHARHSALALPKLASGWICSPWPGYHWKTTGSPSNATRAPPSPAAPVHGLRSGCGAFGKPRVRQNSALRCSCRNAAGMRVEVSRRRRASDSTPRMTARSSLRRWPLRPPATLRARR